MNINDIKSNLQMRNFYFRRYSFFREPVISDGEYHIDLQKHIEPKRKHEYKVILVTIIEKEDLHLELEAQAEFLYEAEDYSREDAIINANTVAIMFPLIRSQVTLLTSQPGMAPIVLPPINTQKLR
ncbi:MAG: protein-export chaperone SecB [Lachnospiraceae bacterium]|nr:protein-export chaperone SecB [Lachnospiraceae bacterium]